MRSDDTSPGPATDVQAQLQTTRSQLGRYAKDLKTLLAREEQKTQQLTRANQQLRRYARDVKIAFETEQQRRRELEQAYTDTVLRLTTASRYKDEETGGHIERLSHYSKALALHMGWKEDEAGLLFAAAPMHDVGKIGIPDAILGKQGPLTEAEWAVIRQHPTLGADLLAGSTSQLLELAREIALTHHERWDGSGYPRGLQGATIPMAGRIVMLVDHYDALRSRRPYKAAYSHEQTVAIMLKGNQRTKPSFFDPELLRAFEEIHQQFRRIYETISCQTSEGVSEETES